MRRARLLLVLAALSSTACATPDAPAQPPSPLLLLNLPPHTIGSSATFIQLVTGDFDGQTHSARFEVEVTDDHLVMAAFSTIGLPLFILEERDDGVHLENLTGGDLPFDPRHMLADFKIVNWPTEPLSAALADVGLRLDHTDTPFLRRVTRPDGTLLVEARTSPDNGGTIIVEHFDYPYRLEIMSSGGGTEP